MKYDVYYLSSFMLCVLHRCYPKSFSVVQTQKRDTDTYVNGYEYRNSKVTPMAFPYPTSHKKSTSINTKCRHETFYFNIIT